MRVLPWRLRPRCLPQPHSRLPHVHVPAVGEYAGRARYMPREVTSLSTQLQFAVGKIVHVELAGVARHDEAFAGQLLFRECAGQSILASAWIPEQDLEFVD